YLITSNSWEYTGDGHALAYHAGAELVDMEFVQFHPTGMVWPPSVRGILVTEGVRGEGGVLKNSEGRRFMFDDIPPLYAGQTAETPEEGWRYVTGDKNARRPPELLTRDHVARKIVKEVKEGRGSPHGGVFLDIAWIKENIKDSEAHIRKKLPSMYHQFKELAGIDITKEPMEVGPTTHYAMGGIRVDPDSQMTTTVRGLFAAGECAGGLHGANRLGGNSLSDLIVFGKRAGEYAAKYAAESGPVKVGADQVDLAAREALAPLERDPGGDVGPFRLQFELQKLMQDKVGIAREEAELAEAFDEIQKLKERAERLGAPGSREYNPGWHTTLDLHNLLTVSEAVALAARERKESRGAHARVDHQAKDPQWGTFNLVLKKGRDGTMELRREPIVEIRQDLKDIIKEQG
ncbi:MAG: FAD-binding protein, partial [Gemmatimonadota bacterium]